MKPETSQTKPVLELPELTLFGEIHCCLVNWCTDSTLQFCKEIQIGKTNV